jgi:hypothetical protein
MTKYQSLLALASALSPTDSTEHGAGLPLWYHSTGFENFALAIGGGEAAQWAADASDLSASGEQTSPAGDSSRSEASANASGDAGSETDSSVTIANGATVDIGGPSAQSVTFTGTTGTLTLEDPRAFTGVISGLAGADAIDLSGLAYGANTTATFLGNASGGTLTVTDGAVTARIALSGNYLSSTWTLSSDGKGGTSGRSDDVHQLADP